MISRHINILILAFFILSGCGDELRKFSPMGCKFEIMLPGRPSRSTLMTKPEGEIELSKRFVLKKHRDYVEIVQTNYIPGAITDKNFEPYFDWVINSITGNQKGKLITKETIVTTEGFAKEYYIEAPISKIYGRIYYFDDTIFSIFISVYDFEPRILDPYAILNSFEVI